MKYPNVTVKLSGLNGNAFNVLGRVREALREAKVDPKEIEKFTLKALNGDYDNLLRTCMKWVNVK